MADRNGAPTLALVTTEPADAQTLAAALRRRARAIIEGESEVDAVFRAVDLIDAGVLLTAEQVVVLVDAIERDGSAHERVRCLLPEEGVPAA